MSTIQADPAQLWDLFSVIGDARAEVSEECDNVFRSLEVLTERMEETKKELDREIGGLEAEREAVSRQIRTAQEENRPTAGLEAEKGAIEARIKALEQQKEDIKKDRRKAGNYREKLTRDKKECLSSMRAGCRKVNRYIRLLEEMLLDQDYQQYQSSVGSSVPGDHSGQYRTMSFRGITFYCNDGAVDIEQTDGQGRSNLSRMEQGLAPVGADGLPVNLHHMQQSATGTVMELPETVHSQNHRQLHVNTSDIPSGINRSTFNTLKSAYWKRRAAFIKKSQGM